MEKDWVDELTSLNTIALKENDEYLINGEKSFVVNGTFSGPMVILCSLKGSGEQVALIAEKSEKGMEAIVIGGRVGMRMVPMANLTLNDLRVPCENLIGEKGQGQLQFIKFLHEMRVETAAMGIGIARGALDLSLAYAKQRIQFGQKIASFEAIRNKFADMATRIETAGLLTYRAAWDLDQNSGDPKINYMAKRVSAETALEVSGDALHIFGGYGYIVEAQIEHFYRDAQMIDLFGEVGQRQKYLIAEQIIGKI
jgi:alkylation response protein AidB-like acyl-CoA dehydrogenase